MDPPFNSKANYNVLFKDESGESKAQIQAFTDFWHWDEESAKAYDYLVTNPNVPAKVSNLISALHSFLGQNQMSAYLVMMATRLIELHRVLKDTGSLYFHCDPTASHYLKILLDAIFGEYNFKNEIIWHYRRWSNTSGSYQNMHDVIFFYTKSNKHTFNTLYQDYTNKEWIENTVRGVIKGKLVRLKDEQGNYIKRKKENNGVPMHDVWEDINFIAPTASERLGYPTQKPVKLLERIITVSSNGNDVVLDPFCGCGTAIDAAEKLGRIKSPDTGFY